MRCERCGSTKLKGHRSPLVSRRVTYRRHRCQDCGLLFLSVQVAIGAQEAERLLNVFEQ